MHRYGAYVLQAEHRKRYQQPGSKPGEKPRLFKETVAQSFGAVTLTYPREYLQLQPSPKECRQEASLCPGLQLLRRVSAATGGVALGEAGTSYGRIFDPGKGKELRYQERWHYLLYLLMGLFLLDIFLRRVRLFGYRPMRAA
jgi:Ca-activated chloride channel family protein